MITNREPWLDDANCAQTDPNIFVLEGHGGNYNQAAKICAACPVVTACLEYALRNEIDDGYYGNKSPRQRARISHAAVA